MYKESGPRLPLTAALPYDSDSFQSSELKDLIWLRCGYFFLLLPGTWSYQHRVACFLLPK